MKRLPLKEQVEPKFISVSQQIKDKARTDVVNRIRDIVTLIIGYCATEEENLVIEMNELSKTEYQIKAEVANIFSDETFVEDKIIDRLEVDCGDGVWLYDREGFEYNLNELESDIIFGIGILIDEYYHKLCAGKI